MVTAEGYLDHIQKLLRDNDIPKLPEEYTENSLLVQIHEDLTAIRETIAAFSSGDFSSDINIQGVIPGCLKTLQSHLRQLTWQVQMRKSLAIINDKLHKEVEHMEQLKESEAHLEFLANHDPLTGILNRRAFIEIVSGELANAAEIYAPCCLAMMDIDHFTNFNETYGHSAGDEALCHTVKTIESKLRKHDFLGRYGEGKFILFFYGIDEKIGVNVLERLREILSSSPVPLESGSAKIYASFGFVVTKTNEKEKVEEKGNILKLIEEADAALFTAKQAGRNRVVGFVEGMRVREGGDGIEVEVGE
jgi:diguanylate cyclase (GGDEF)-like protein